ncbi:MAG: Asp-tRNA(Asn)/Glu-tRNA(Gln) amidotransferase GatCAB subunit C [Oscillospiraceae bacterium]|nr:Asp-tRNA(Asn)/Glu-tRNA(Gln) amidotransferase GatCAB subunit C [Oscillospiraceae bacterium]
MDDQTFKALCDASYLSFNAEEKEEFTRNLESIIDFASTVKQYDCAYDETEDMEYVSLSDLREDVMLDSYPPEKLLENTEPFLNCYVIPKLMDN